MNLTYRQPYIYVNSPSERYARRGRRENAMRVVVMGDYDEPYIRVIGYAIYYSAFMSGLTRDLVMDLSTRWSLFKTKDKSLIDVVGDKWEL